MAKTNAPDEPLKGWQAIAGFLGQPVAVAQRWARDSQMPVSRQGRYAVALPEELNRWLGRESGEPVQIATASTDLAADLRRSLSHVRQTPSPKPEKRKEQPKR
jgi:hypothetical protein